MNSFASDPEPTLEPLAAPPTLTEATADLLRERILSGIFRPGTRLVEAEIARQLGISRGPVREAIAILCAEGLAREDPRRSASVTQLTVDDVREIYEVRAALEGEAARRLCALGDDASIVKLRCILEELRDAARRSDRLRFSQLDLQLHEELCRLAGNTRLLKVWANQVGTLRALVRLEVTTQHETLEPLLADHELLIDEIATGEPDRASAACRRHATEALERVMRMMQLGDALTTLDKSRRRQAPRRARSGDA